MTDDSYKLANDRELIEMRRGAVEDLAEYRDNLEAIDGEISRRGLRVAPNDVEDEFAPGECDGSSACVAAIHVHGCYRPHRADQCDSPDEYGHLPSERQGEPSDDQPDPWGAAVVAGRAEAARRVAAAGGVQGSAQLPESSALNDPSFPWPTVLPGVADGASGGAR